MQSQLQVAQYRFVDRLAVGGMAEVFVAIAQGAAGFERPVVIKRLLPQLAASTRFRKMFLDEARIMASLQHGNIVQILDTGTLDGLPFLALEYVDGRDLRTVLQRAEDRGITIPHGLMAFVVSEVCRALDYAHRKQDEDGVPLGIVHRDINPANIFVSYEGVVKLGDFGLAKATGRLELSEEGIVKGKISYLSPEQAQGEPIDSRSDIFSLGTTLYETTCGRLPFVGNHDAEVVMAIREAKIARPSEVSAGYPPGIEAVVLRAMERDPEQRYETAGQMRADLLRYMHEVTTPVDDRLLAALLAELFAAERRSQSHLVRLPPADTLPPPMVSVADSGPFPAYRHTTPPAPIPAVGGTAKDAPPPIPAPAEPTAAAPAVSPPGPRASRASTLVLLAMLAIAAVVAALLLQRVIAPAHATLRVTSTPPGARVLLDGTFIGQRTPATIENLEVGRTYVLGLEHPQAASVRRRVGLREPRAYAQSFILEPLVETLNVDSRPTAADVQVDGELRGQAPIALRLKRGSKYAITLLKVGYQPKTIQHRAERAEASLSIELQPESAGDAPPRAEVATRRPTARTPRGGVLELAVDDVAKVYIDGRYAGNTPDFRQRMPAGRYRVSVVPETGNVRHEATVEIAEGKTQRLRLTPPATP